MKNFLIFTLFVFALLLVLCADAVTVPFSAFNSNEFNVSVPNNSISINTSVFPTNAILSIAYTNAGPSTTYITNGNAITALLNTNPFAGGSGGSSSGFPFTTNGVSYSITPLGQFVVSNTVTSAYFLIGTNGHISSFDQYGGSMQLTTNKFSITNNANSLLFSNGVLAINGNPVSTNGISGLTGDVTATAIGNGVVSATVVQVNGLSASQVALGANAANAASVSATANVIPLRDASGNLMATAFIGGGSRLTGTLTNNTTGSAATATIASNITLLASAPAIAQYESNLVFWFNPRAIITTNNFFTLSSVADSSGNGNTMYNDASAQQVIYSANAFNGNPCLLMHSGWNRATGVAPTTAFYALTNLMWNTSNNSNFCIFDVFQDTLEIGQNTGPVTANAPAFLLGIGNNVQTFIEPFGGQGSGAGFSGVAVAQLSGGTQGLIGLRHNFTPNVLCIRVINGVQDFWLNGVRVINLGNTVGNTATGSNFTIGNINNGGTLFNSGRDAFCGNQSDFLLFTNQMPASSVSSISAYLMQNNGIGNGTAIDLWGDSIMIGAFSTSGYSNFLALAQNYNPHAFVTDFGISGANSGQVLSYMTNAASAQPPNTGNTIDVFMEMVNDISQSVSLATFETHITNALNFSHWEGHKFDICTSPSFSGETGGSFTRAQGNSFIYSLTNTVNQPDSIIDFASDSIMGTNGASVQSGTAYFANSVHPNAAGYYQLYTAEMGPVLQSQLSGNSANYGPANFTGNASTLTNYSAVNLTTNGANPAPAQGQVLAVQAGGGIAFTNPASGGGNVNSNTVAIFSQTGATNAAVTNQFAGTVAANYLNVSNLIYSSGVSANTITNRLATGLTVAIYDVNGLLINSTVTAAQLASIVPAAITNNQTGVINLSSNGTLTVSNLVINGSGSGNGSGLTNVSASMIGPITITNTSSVINTFTVTNPGLIASTIIVSNNLFSFQTNSSQPLFAGSAQSDANNGWTNQQAWIYGFNVPIIQAGFTNVTLVAATTQVITFLHPMPAWVGTNYVPAVTLNGLTVAGSFQSSLTTNGFTQNMTALTFTGPMLWTAISITK